MKSDEDPPEMFEDYSAIHEVNFAAFGRETDPKS
jgi:hypothetical protein